MPYCLVCRVGFKSPMEFETHRCSLDHIKVISKRFFVSTLLLLMFIAFLNLEKGTPRSCTSRDRGRRVRNRSRAVYDC